jgi:hypothetical protein
MRILIAGILGGIAMYIWSSLAHGVLPLGRVGVSTLPNEAAVVATLKTNLGDKAGLYEFPADMNAKTGPGGTLVYHTDVTQMGPSTLGSEAVVEIAESILAAVLLSFAALSTYIGRVGFVSLVGLTAQLATNPSYMIWYKYPADYTCAYMLIGLVGYLVAGLVIAAVLKPKT